MHGMVRRLGMKRLSYPWWLWPPARSRPGSCWPPSRRQPGGQQRAGSLGLGHRAAANLVATDTESGTLGFANPQTVYNRLSGTITWLPTWAKRSKPAADAVKVDNQPVVLMTGTTPAYRALSSGVSDGPDVLELNQNLINLGFDPSHEITVIDTWQTGTTDAVNRWRAALGEDQTGA